MRIFVFVVIAVAGLWLVDVFFYKSRYSNQLWLGTVLQVQKTAHEVRRWTKL